MYLISIINEMQVYVKVNMGPTVALADAKLYQGNCIPKVLFTTVVLQLLRMYMINLTTYH